MVHGFCDLFGIVDCVTNNAFFSIPCSSSSPNSQYCLQTHVLSFLSCVLPCYEFYILSGLKVEYHEIAALG